jgi:hypothetical protein
LNYLTRGDGGLKEKVSQYRANRGNMDGPYWTNGGKQGFEFVSWRDHQEKGTQLVVNGKTGVEAGGGGPPPEDFCMFNL